MVYFLLRLVIFITPFYLLPELICGIIQWRYNATCWPLLLHFNLFGVPITALEISIYILFSVWLLRGGWRDFKDWLRAVSRYIYWPIFLVFLGATLSTIFSRDIIASGGIWKAYFLDPLLFLLMFIAIFYKLETKNYNILINNLLRWFLTSGYIVAITALVYLWTGNLTYDGRLRAFYQSPNHLAMFLAPILLVNIYFLFTPLEVISNGARRSTFLTGFKAGLLFMCFILGAIIFFTYSYGAWIGLITAIIFYIFYAKIQKIAEFLNQTIIQFRNINRIDRMGRSRAGVMMVISRIGVILIIGLILSGFLFYGVYNLPPIADYFDATGRSSLHSRIMIWQSSLKMLKDNPILGIGPGMFQEYYLEYQKYFPPYLEWAVPQPHNIFLAFWLQTGIIGLIGFLWFLISVFYSIFLPKTNVSQADKFQVLSFKKKAEIDPFNNLYVLILSFLVYFLIHGLVDTIYWKNDLALIFWFFAGIALITMKAKIDQEILF